MLKVEINGDNSKFDSAVKRTQRAIAGLGASFISYQGVTAAIDAFRKMTDYAGQVTDLTAQTGLSADSVMVWGQALKNAGLNADSLQQIMNRLQKAMTGVNADGQATNKAFDRMGISISALRGMSPDDQLNAIKDAISGIADPADRAAIAMEIFGRSGGKALALFTDGQALDTARQQLGALADNIGSNIEALDKLSDALNAAGEIKSMQLMAGFAEAFSGDMDKAAKSVNQIDLSNLGKHMGAAASGAKSWVENLRESGSWLVKIQDTLALLRYINPGYMFLKGSEEEGARNYYDKKAADALAKNGDPLAAPKAAEEKKAEGFKPLPPTGHAPLGSSLNLMTESVTLAGQELDIREKIVSLIGDQATGLKDINGASESLKKTSDAVLLTLGGQAEQMATISDIQAGEPVNKPDKDKGNPVIASSLARIGGGGNYSAAMGLQKEANGFLKTISKATTETTIAIANLKLGGSTTTQYA